MGKESKGDKWIKMILVEAFWAHVSVALRVILQVSIEMLLKGKGMVLTRLRLLLVSRLMWCGLFGLTRKSSG